MLQAHRTRRRQFNQTAHCVGTGDPPTTAAWRRHSLAIAISGALALGLINAAKAQDSLTISLSALDGETGFRLDGVAETDFSGRAVSAAGDVNGDGIDDVLIGAYLADPNGTDSGSSYIVFGKLTAFAASLDLSTLSGANGFRLDGAAPNDQFGVAVSAAGDVNGDGIDDVLIGAWRAAPYGQNSGSSYIVFGKSTAFPATLDVNTLNGANGFRLNGTRSGELSGRKLSNAGDVNGDGIDDFVIGARDASPNNISGSGSSYVVFGSNLPFAATMSLESLNGANGFRLDGVALGDRSGSAVSGAGDVNGDGIDDLLIGADGADPNGNYSGSSYVVFGKSGDFAPTLNLSALNGPNGFRIDGDGAALNGFSGYAVSIAGDVNGDGFDDLLIGAFGDDPNGVNSGSSYVVFGSSSRFSATLNLTSLDGTNGFRLDGAETNDYAGFAVSAAGDVNGDSIDDLQVGARGANPSGDYSGSSYVVFGKSTFPATMILSNLSRANGFRIDGAASGDVAGFSLSSAGDVNGDGIDDLLIGALGADPNGASSGSSYVVFGAGWLFADGFE